MINLSEMEVTMIQFFDCSDGDGEYSANIILDEKLVVQLSGNNNLKKVSIPSAVECYYNDEKLQEWACEHLDLKPIKEFLKKEGIENTRHYLSENGESYNCAPFFLNNI